MTTPWLVVDGEATLDGVDADVAVAHYQLAVDGRPLALGTPAPVEAVAAGRVTTAAPSPGDYARCFAAGGGRPVLCVVPGAALSAAATSARVAAHTVAFPVTVVDSGTGGAGHAVVCRAALSALRDGADLAGAVAAAETAAAGAVMAGALAGLQAAARSGRVPGLVAGVADRLGVRPVFALSRAGGTRVGVGRSDRRCLELLRNHRLAQAGACTGVVAWHAGALSLAADLAVQLTRLGDAVDVIAAGPATAVHTGLGAVGWALVRTDP